jgi:hypothetical protein
MVAEDFLQDQQVRQWLDGVEPAWTLLTFDSLRALRQEPSARQNAIRIANDLSADESAGSAVTRNTLMLLRQAIERGGLPLTATSNLSRAVVAEMRGLIEWPHYDQSDAFRLNKVINEPDFLPLHVVRILAQAATLVRAQRGKLVATPLGKSMLSHERQGSLLAFFRRRYPRLRTLLRFLGATFAWVFTLYLFAITVQQKVACGVIVLCRVNYDRIKQHGAAMPMFLLHARITHQLAQQLSHFKSCAL